MGRSRHRPARHHYYLRRDCVSTDFWNFLKESSRITPLLLVTSPVRKRAGRFLRKDRTMLITKPLDNFYNLKKLDRFMVGHKGFIAGGCFKNVFNNEPMKDIDIFFESNADFLEAKKYYADKTDNYYLYYENKNVTAYKERSKYHNNPTIELVQTIFGTAEEIINSFDFTIVKFAYFKEQVNDGEEIFVEYKVMHDENFFEHLQRKRLVIDNQMPFPVSTFERVLRYARYGYFPCRETKVRLIEALREVEDLEGLSSSLYHGLD
jgi:hypothetical protein